MSLIVTITFSPCIDKNISVPALVPERKLVCTAPVIEPGGGGINVARAIKKLGGEAIAIYPSGGYTGKYLDHLLKKESIPTLIIDVQKETRENIIVFDQSIQQQYRLGMPGTPLTEDEWMKCLDAVKKISNPAYIIASGSLPPDVPVDIYAKLSAIASNKQAKYIVDTSGEALKQAAEETVFLLKPSLRELATLAGVENIRPADAPDIAKEFMKKKNCSVMVVSLGAEGAIMITGNNVYRAVAPKVDQKSTVGAGDSMVAGIVYGLSKGMSGKRALEFGVACGTAAVLNPGTQLCKKEDAEKLFAMINHE